MGFWRELTWERSLGSEWLVKQDGEHDLPREAQAGGCEGGGSLCRVKMCDDARGESNAAQLKVESLFAKKTLHSRVSLVLVSHSMVVNTHV